MCGRYTLSTPAELVREVFEVEQPFELAPRYNIAPTQPAPVIRTDSDGVTRRLDLLRWGLVPAWAKEPSFGAKTINARSETVAETRSFKDAFSRRRCLVPADGFFEWQRRGGRKQPFLIAAEDARPLAFAGLHESWGTGTPNALESFTILTTTANEKVRPIHDRMPVILPPTAFATWLDSEFEDGVEVLSELLVPYPADLTKLVPVSTIVNSVHNDSPDCISPVTLELEPRNLSLFDSP